MRRALLLTGLLSALAAESPAWPTALMQALNRDARRLVPRSLARLLGEREREVLEETRRFPPELVQLVAVDLSAGRLRPETLAALDAEAGGVGEMFRQQRISEGLVRLGGLMRIPADLADPVLSAGPEGYPAGVTGEYYAFVVASLDKMPVVLDDPPALRLSRRDLPDYWQGLVERSRAQSPLIGSELFRDGRLVDHRRIDFRSPVYGVASLSYSRAVTAIAATWIAIWRDARGDTTRMPRQRQVAPKEDAPPLAPPARRGPQENPPPKEEAQRPPGQWKVRSQAGKSSNPPPTGREGVGVDERRGWVTDE